MLARAGRRSRECVRGGNASLGHHLTDIIGAMAPFDARRSTRLRAPDRTLAGHGRHQFLAPLQATTSNGAMSLRRGDTLWDIARRLTGNGLNWPALLENHNRRVELGLGGRRIDNPSLIRIGERIHVPTSDDEPGAMRYHVSRGESLSASPGASTATRSCGRRFMRPIGARYPTPT